MIRLTYVSTAATALDAKEVDALAKLASQKNTRANISGVLVYNGRNFLQVLEGDGDAVEALMRKIEADPRHSGVKRLASEDPSEARFPEAGMMLVTTAGPTSEWGALQELMAQILIDQLPEETQSLLKAVLSLN